MITGKTRIVAIFGDPVEHSLSPVMHNAAFAALGLDMAYVAFRVSSKEKGALKRAVEAMRAMNLAGANVTIPHKEKVARYLDSVDPAAREIGAVNTIVNRGGRLKGYNTDGTGYLRSLKRETGFAPRGKNVLVVGAGGAARSIVHALLSGGAERVVMANRTPERARALARSMSALFGKSAVEAAPLDERLYSIVPALSPSLVVNTTSMGMGGKDDLELPLELLKRGAVVSDIVYAPLATGLLKSAAAMKLKTHTGIGMLVHQGAVGFELWTGRRAPVEVMLKEAMKALRPRSKG